MTPTAKQVRAALAKLADPAKAKLLAGFFKTAPGQYGAGDRFLGITVPAQRALAAQFLGLPLKEVLALLHSPIHEERLTAFIILVDQFKRSKDEAQRAKLVKAYLGNLKWVNNWDLVDLSAHELLGAWLLDKDRSMLYRLAKSKVLWERRVAVVSTYHFIYRKESKDILALAEMLLQDDEDLMHKATGWMLREMGKRASLTDLRGFLGKHAATMPRTALRYAIEKMDDAERRKWMARKAK